jgi:penicillin-binding protein 1A
MGYLILVIGLIASIFFYTAVRDLPSVDAILKQGVSPTHYSQVYGVDGSVILSYGKFSHRAVKLSAVSPHFINALLATEDRRFYEHHGVDVIALARAIGRDIVQRRLLEGGSTLTQQLARNVFLSNERSLRRKIREAILAVELENHLNKKQILEMYVNNIYFGEGAYGIAAASDTYFGKTPDRLTIDEAALLAGLPQAPSTYNPFQNPDSTTRRRNEVLDNLKEWGKLTPGQVALAKQQQLHLNPKGQSVGISDRAPFFNRYIMRQIQEKFDLDEQRFWQSGYKIYTTLNPKAQRIASQVVQEQSLHFGRTRAIQQAALLCIDPKTGGVLAYVGGKDYQKSQFDRVSQATRSPGSLFKVFTYATAIEKGIDPYRRFMDDPIYFGSWHPENFDKAHHGVMPMYKAFYTSNNVIAVKLLRELHPPAVIELARRMGITANLNDDLALTLGGSGVTLLDMTAAFSVIANQGIRNEPYAIERIVDAQGQEIYKHKALPTQVLQRPTTDTMVSMMQMVVNRGTGRSADFGSPAAGKTGTSDNHRDAWFIGFTPALITGVWVGNDDNTSMPGMVGGTLPSAIWRNFMQGVSVDKMQTQFDVTYSKLVHRPKAAPVSPVTQQDDAGVNNADETLNDAPTDAADDGLHDELPPSELAPAETPESDNLPPSALEKRLGKKPRQASPPEDNDPAEDTPAEDEPSAPTVPTPPARQKSGFVPPSGPLVPRRPVPPPAAQNDDAPEAAPVPTADR